MSLVTQTRLSSLIFSDTIPEPDQGTREWLLLEDSVTQRFAQYCQKLTVEVCRQGFTDCPSLTDEYRWLPEASRYWLREIILLADGVPWLMARTLAPESTLTGDEQQLQQLGNTPLGNYLFSHPELTRDFIQPGRSGELWGRRSRLRLAGKPLLLTELFLSPSPLYCRGGICKDI